MTAYEARYGKEVADWERRYQATMDNALLRLEVIQRALESVAWLGDDDKRLHGHTK